LVEIQRGNDTGGREQTLQSRVENINKSKND